MISYKQIDKSYFKQYDAIDMLIDVKSIYKPTKLNNGLGGIIFNEIAVKPYVKDMTIYEKAVEYEEQFNIENWAFFMAFENDIPIGATTVVAKTKEVLMLDGREDLSVLWDLRITSKYKHQKIGTQLFNLAKNWSKEQGLKQMKIECQNINVAACNFYAKQGAILSAFNEYAYYKEQAIKDEIQLIWYLNL